MDGALTDGPTVRSGGPTTTDSGLEDGGTEGNERREKEWGEVGGEGGVSSSDTTAFGASLFRRPLPAALRRPSSPTCSPRRCPSRPRAAEAATAAAVTAAAVVVAVVVAVVEADQSH